MKQKIPSYLRDTSCIVIYIFPKSLDSGLQARSCSLGFHRTAVIPTRGSSCENTLRREICNIKSSRQSVCSEAPSINIGYNYSSSHSRLFITSDLLRTVQNVMCTHTERNQFSRSAVCLFLNRILYQVPSLKCQFLLKPAPSC